ncbi:MAG: hypothetical protein RLZZ292_794 [Bacteroidota bacterium]|jgi:hypothetical protein
MQKNIINALKTGEETYELWSEWIATAPSDAAIRAFVDELLALENDADFDVNENFVELWELVESVFEDWETADIAQHWRVREMLYNMAVTIDMDNQSVFEILGNFAEAKPNYANAMQFYLQAANDADWRISDLEDALDRIENPEYAAECRILYAKNTLIYAAQSGIFSQKTQANIIDSIKTAKQHYPTLTWAALADIFEDNDFEGALVADLKGDF